MNCVQKIKVADEDEGIRLDRWFKRWFPEIAHGRLQKWLRTGQVRVDGGVGEAQRQHGQVILHSNLKYRQHYVM